MWETKYSVKTKAKKEAIWKLWTDVENWKEWDKSVKWSNINGDFKVGTKGQLKPKEGPVANFELIEVETFKKFVDQAKLPLAKIQFIHEIIDADNEVEIVHKIKIFGPLTFLFSRVIGKKLEKELPQSVNNLLQFAKE